MTYPCHDQLPPEAVQPGRFSSKCSKRKEKKIKRRSYVCIFFPLWPCQGAFIGPSLILIYVLVTAIPTPEDARAWSLKSRMCVTMDYDLLH